MSKIKTLKYRSIDYRYGGIGDSQSDVRIMFNGGNDLMKFVNNGERIFKGDYYNRDKSLYRIVKFKKFKHFSVIATIERITLREYNLERLGI